MNVFYVYSLSKLFFSNKENEKQSNFSLADKIFEKYQNSLADENHDFE